MADQYCPTCAGEGEIEIPDTWDVSADGNDSDGPFICEHAACPTCGGDGLTPEGRTMSVSILEFGGRTLYTQPNRAFIEAQTLADANGCPCVVWERDGWHLACEVCPELMDVAPEKAGWVMLALVDPRAAWHAPEMVEHEDEGDPSENNLTWNAVS